MLPTFSIFLKPKPLKTKFSKNNREVKMRRPKSRAAKKQHKNNELQEIEILNQWIESEKPESGSNPLSHDPLKPKSPIGRITDPETGAVSFSRYAGARKFYELPISKKTKNGLGGKFKKMTDIQVASLPHALCGRDILGAAKTGSGKTLAFVIPMLEKLHRERWGPEDGVGSIIISPTRELANQTFDVLKIVQKYHKFSAGLLIGGHDVDVEKERVNELNILICTPGRLLQHMDETPNFDCSQLQVLVLDEADRILDIGFKKTLDAIVSQLPKRRQTLLFSATQTRSVKDLARLSLEDPEYISVHEKAEAATPNRLQQTAMIVPLEQKLNMLWSFIKAHLRSKILVFLSSCKEVKFAFEAFKKLRPGIPLKCLHGRMNQKVRMAIYAEFCESRSVLFSTDVASRGLDFNKAVDWVVQMDCPEDVASYIHRVGRTARYLSGGRSLLFLLPSEMKMLEKLQAAKVPIQCIQANTKRLEEVSELLKHLLVKYPDMKHLAQRAFITYLRSIHIQKDKEVFDVTKLPIEEYSASLGLPMTPKVRFLKQKKNNKIESEKSTVVESERFDEENESFTPKEELLTEDVKDNKEDGDFVLKDATRDIAEGNPNEIGDVMPGTRVSKKKKLKINVHRPVGTRVVFDEEGNTQAPLAMLADKMSGEILLDQDKKAEYYKKMREELKQVDKEDKLLERQRLRDIRIKKKMKLKKVQMEDEDEDDEEENDLSGSERESDTNRKRKRSKIYFHSDSDDGEKEENKTDAGINADSISLAEQEQLALKLLNSMHS